MNEKRKKAIKKIAVISMLTLNTVPLFSAILETTQTSVQAAEKKSTSSSSKSPDYQNVYVDKNGAITADNNGGKNRVATNDDDNRKGGNNADNRKSGSTGSSGSSGSSGVSDPTKISSSEYTKPDHYWAWLQYWGPWADNFGGQESWTNVTGKNIGCVSTSMAIQAARGGMNGTPSDFPMYNRMTNLSYSKGGITASRDAGSGDSDGHMSLADALKACQKIASAGNYPLLRVGQKFAGYGSNTHTMAYWKAGNGQPLYYDPSRSASGTVFNGTVNYVGEEKVTGKGAKKFSEDSPGPGGEGAFDSSDSSKDSSGSGSGSGGSGSGSSNQLPIKPIFNPFYSPSIHYVPADKQSGADVRQSQIMQAADGNLPTVLGWVRNIVGFLAIAYAAYAVISILFAIGDLWMGGIIQTYVLDKTRGSMTGGLFFPGGKFMGVDTGVTGNGATMAIIKAGFRRYTLVLIVSTIVASGAMSWIVATSISLIGTLFGAS